MTTVCVWLTGAKGAGKTTIARAVVDELRDRGRAAVVIDEAEARRHLSETDPVAAVAWLARLLVQGNVVAVVAVDTPERALRERIRAQVPSFVEVFVDGGEASTDYEEPFAAELRVPTRDRDAAASAAQVMSYLEDAGVIESD